jgi:hypothetical protein
MSQLVRTKRQANFQNFKRLEPLKGLVEEKNVVFNSLNKLLVEMFWIWIVKLKVA